MRSLAWRLLIAAACAVACTAQGISYKARPKETVRAMEDRDWSRSHHPVVLLRHDEYASDTPRMPVDTAVCSTVTCPAKRQCQEKNGRARCTCKLHCPSLWKRIGPVCGTDGKTYRSLCLLRRSNCRQEDVDIYFKHPGVCSVSKAAIKITGLKPAHPGKMYPTVMSNYLPGDGPAVREKSKGSPRRLGQFQAA